MRAAPRASSRSSSRSSSTTFRACGACGSTSSASAAASGREAPASRSSRPTAVSRAAGSRCSRSASRSSASSATRGASSAAARRRRRSRSPATRTSGKSTLLNALTGAEASVDNRLFETLDPTTRGFEHDGRKYLVTDTVGFIRRLPTQLVEGFAATLEETLVADLVLHVADASVPEDRLQEQLDAVNAVLDGDRGDGAADRARPEQDRRSWTRSARRRLANRFPDALQVSARTGEGLDELRARVAERFAHRYELVELLVPYGEGGKLAELYALGPPIESRTDREDGVLIRARLPERDVRRFARFLVTPAA